MDKVRAKFICDSKTENRGEFSIILMPVTSGSKENEEFYKYTPWGRLELGGLKKEIADGMKVGGEYYIDITAAEVAK